MRSRIALALLVCGLLLLGNVWGQEAKSTSRPLPNIVDPDMVWNFHFEGKKKRGQFIEFLSADEARGRTLMISYLDLDKIESAFDPIKETMSQFRELGRNFGTFNMLGTDPMAAKLLLETHTDIKPKPVRRWTRADIGKVKSARTRGAKLSRLASTLGRTPNAVYKLVSRLKRKGEIN